MAVVYEDLTNEAYHADPSSISRSAIMEFIKSPANYWNSYRNPERPAREETEAMKLGTAFHMRVLESDLYAKTYAVLPDDIDRRTKKGKELYEAFLKESHGRIILKEEQATMIRKMKDSVIGNPTARGLLEEAFYEYSIFWDDRNTGLQLKTRPDVWHSNMTVDLKTTISADPRTFQRAMVSHGYHLQAAMNREGIREVTGEDIKKHVFICVEKTFPFLSAVYILDESALDTAHNTLRRALSEMKSCIDNDTWPGYEPQVIGLPSWANTISED